MAERASKAALRSASAILGLNMADTRVYLGDVQRRAGHPVPFVEIVEVLETWTGRPHEIPVDWVVARLS